MKLKKIGNLIFGSIRINGEVKIFKGTSVNEIFNQLEEVLHN